MISQLPNGKQQFFDNSGNPCANGFVYFYIPTTTTPKDTWQDPDKNALNTNPVLLDGNGRATIYGYGRYRQLLRDSAMNVIWDVDTLDFVEVIQDGAPRWGGVSTGAAGTYNVTMSPALTQYQAGQQITWRAHQASIGNDTINVNGLGNINLTKYGSTHIGAGDIALGQIVEAEFDGTQWQVNNPVFVVPAAIAAGSVMFSAAAAAPSGWLFCFGQAVSRATFATLFAAIGTVFGAGDGATTFNLPDLRGRTAFGLDNMGGTPANRVTFAGSGIAGTTLGATGGDQLQQSHGHGAVVTDPGHDHNIGLELVDPFSGSIPIADGLVEAHDSGVPAAGTTAVATTGIGVTIGNTGAGNSQNMPPALMLNFIIKT